MFRGKSVRGTALLVAVSLVAAACGGDGGSAGRVPPTEPGDASESTGSASPADAPAPVAGADRTGASTDPDGSGESATVVAESGSIVEPIHEPDEAPEPSEPPTVQPESSQGPERAEESEPSEGRAGGSQPSGETDPGEEAQPSEQPAEQPSEQPEVLEVPQTSEPPETFEPPETSEPPETLEPPETPEPPEVTEPAAPAPEMLEFSGCGRAYLCATLAVPMDHDDPGAGSVELAVGMVPAGDPSRRIGFLLANPGGPGGGMEGFLDGGAGLSAGLLDRFDVVGWDPRGAGGSVPANCRPETNRLYLLDPIADSPQEQSALDEAARAVAEACAAALGDVVGRIGTIDTVRDIDAIRRALGAEEISYVGFSYGTLLGALYADQFGEHLRAAVLDGAVDPSLTSLESGVGQMIGFDRAIGDMFDSCRNDPRCPVEGDPREAYENLRERVESDPLTGPGGEVVVGPAEVVLAAILASYLSELWPFFFDALAQAAGGNGEMLQRWALGYLEFDLGAFISIGCADFGVMSPEQLDELEAAMVEVAGDFGLASATSARPCAYWPTSSGTLSAGPVAAPNAPPIVVLGNRGDNATPYEWAVSLADQLESGVLVSYDGAGHLSYGKSLCVDSLVDGYLIDLVVPADGLECGPEF